MRAFLTGAVGRTIRPVPADASLLTRAGWPLIFRAFGLDLFSALLELLPLSDELLEIRTLGGDLDDIVVPLNLCVGAAGMVHLTLDELAPVFGHDGPSFTDGVLHLDSELVDDLLPDFLH